MNESLESPPTNLDNIAARHYEVDGSMVELRYRGFQPKSKEPLTAGSETNPHSTVIFLPGWSFTHMSKINEPLLTTFASVTDETSYSVETRADKPGPNSIDTQAGAVLQFIKEKGLSNVTIVGNSLGGVEAINTVARLRKDMPQVAVDGLILLDAVSLYPTSTTGLVASYLTDLAETNVAMFGRADHTSRTPVDASTRARHRLYIGEGAAGVTREVLRSKAGYLNRFGNEVKQMIRTNPACLDIDVPVVLVNGEKDRISHPSRIIPDSSPDSETGYLSNFTDREAHLKKTLFPNAPRVGMVVAQRLGNHNLMYMRPEQVASASFYMLQREKRKS